MRHSNDSNVGGHGEHPDGRRALRHHHHAMDRNTNAYATLSALKTWLPEVPLLDDAFDDFYVDETGVDDPVLSRTH